MAAQTYQNYYSILGVKPEATSEEIKKAYRLLARTWHPDTNSSPDAEAHFKLIAKAYEILSDKTSRARYDQEKLEQDDLLPPVIRLGKRLVDFGTITSRDKVVELWVSIYNDGGDGTCGFSPESGSFWAVAGDAAHEDDAYASLVLTLTLDNLDPGSYTEDLMVTLDNKAGIVSGQYLSITINFQPATATAPGVAAAVSGMRSTPMTSYAATPGSILGAIVFRVGPLVGAFLLLGLPFLIMYASGALNSSSSGSSIEANGWIIGFFTPLFCFGLFCLGCIAVVRATIHLFD